MRVLYQGSAVSTFYRSANLLGQPDSSVRASTVRSPLGLTVAGKLVDDVWASLLATPK